MVEIQIDVDVRQANRFIRAAAEKQIPFASARALTQLAQMGRKSALERIKSQYKIRNRAMLNERTGPVRIVPARKSDWPKQSSTVGLPTWALFLIRHEKGGIIRSKSGHAMAIPTRLVDHKRTAKGRVPKRLRPRALRGRKSTRVADTGGDRTIFVPVRRGGQMLAHHLLKPSIKLKPTLGFVETVREETEGAWSRVLTKNLVDAVNSRRLPRPKVRR